MKQSEIYRLLENNGFYAVQGKKHILYVNPITGRQTRIGRHGSQEVPNGTLNRILKEAGLK